MPTGAAMRQCPVCGENIDAHAGRCPVCGERTGFDGTAVNRQPEPEPEQTYQPEPEPEPRRTYQPEPEPERPYETEQAGPSGYTPMPPPVEKKSNALKWVLIALCALVVAGLGVLAYLLLNKDKEDEGKDTEENKVETVKTDTPVSEETIQIRLDSVAMALPESDYLIETYLDKKCFYYLTNGKMMVYHADTNKTEEISFPKTDAEDLALSAEVDSEDENDIILEIGDAMGNHKAYYRFVTSSGEFEKMEEPEEEVVEQPVKTTTTTTTTPAKTTNKTTYQAEEQYYDEPDESYEYRDRGDRRRGMYSREERRRRMLERGDRRREGFERGDRGRDGYDRPRRAWRDGDEPRDPRVRRGDRDGRRGGTGFHFEPANGGTNAPSSSSGGDGFHFERTDRIPNQ